MVSGPPGDDLVLLGAIAGAHGVRGAVTVKSFTAVPEDLVAYGPLTDATGRRRFRLRLTGRSRGSLVVAVEGVGDRDAAEALRGTQLFVRRAALPPPEEEDSYYYSDLLGLRVETLSGKVLGKVVAIDDHGAGDVLTVRGSSGADLLLPFTKGVVPTVDLDSGVLVVDPPREVEAGPESGSAEGD